MVNWPSLSDIKTTAFAYARKADKLAEDVRQYTEEAQRYVEEQVLHPVSIAVESTEKTIAQLPDIIDKKAGNFVENHPKAVKAALTGVAVAGFLLSPNKILALGMLGGCAEPQEGPCGCPPIVDKNGDPIDPELENAMCATIEEAESHYSPLTCNVEKIIVAPKSVIEEECGEYGKLAGGCFVEQNNQVFILDSTLILQPATPFSTTLSLALSSRPPLLHEIIHLRQVLNEKNNDMGFNDYEEDICSQTTYVGYDKYFDPQTTLKYDSALITHYSLASCEEDHTEALSWLYVYPERSLASSNPDYIERVNFAEDQWGKAFFPPDYPGQINATYHTTTLPPYNSSSGTFAIFQAAVAYVEYEHYPYFGSDGTLNPYCPVYFYPYDTQSNNFPETPIEINMPFPVKNLSPDSEYLIGGECFLEMNTVSFTASKMASIYSYDGAPTLIISDWETGEYIQTELDLPPEFNSAGLHTTIYDKQIYILPDAIDLAEYDKTTELSFPRYDLDSGAELDPLYVTDLNPLINNGYTGRLSLSQKERDPSNPYLLIYSSVEGSSSDTPPAFDGLFLINLSTEPNQPALISAETTYSRSESLYDYSTVSPNGEITYFTSDEDLYTSDEVYRLYKKPLGTETRQLVSNTNYIKYSSAARGYQFTIGETIYFINYTDCEEDNSQACEYYNATILELETTAATTLKPE